MLPLPGPMKRFTSLALLLCLACASVPRPAPPADPQEFEPAAVDAFVARKLAEQKVPGAALVVVRDGKTVLAKGYGLSSRENGTAADADTSFAIGSNTKQFTCAALLLLQQEGKLSLDDKVAKYYPDLTSAGEITLRDLVNHVSGYPDYYPLDFVDRRMQKPIDPDQLIRQYAGGKLDFEPGTRWSYSNTGFVIAGRVVEKVSGEAFGEFLAKRIFQPLGMSHTFYSKPTGGKV